MPVPGKGDDDGRYFRCWNCGFVCDSQRDELGDSESRGGDDHTNYYRYAQPDSSVSPTDKTKKLCLAGPIGHYHTIMELGYDGSTPKTITHPIKSDVSRGCPFCGSTNWRGDY